MKESPMEKKPGVIYARYSSHNQREESIEQQVEECLQFADANNIKIVRVYADKAISGKTDKRPQFQHMMRDAEKREFSVVVAYKSNRIARNMLNALSYEDKLGRFGIETLYAKEEFGNTAAGRFALRSMMNINQFYSENLAEDVRRGMRDNAENCKVNGIIPYGYVRGPDGRYAVDEAAAAVVREIFGRVLAGDAYACIAADLNRRGIKSKRGLWNKNSFRRMLTNDAYIGVYRHSGCVIEGGVPPILDREVFDKMQEYVEGRKPPRKRQNHDYLLTGKLFCGHCGSPMVGVSGTSHTGDKHYYYSCNGRRDGCKKKNARKDYIEQAVVEAARRFVLQDDVIAWIADSAMEILKESSSDGEIAAMEAERDENKKALKNILNAIEQGIITPTTKERLLELETAVADNEKAIAIVKGAQRRLSTERSRIVYALEQFRDGNADDEAYRKRIIDTFVKSVYLWDDKIRIDYHTGGSHSLPIDQAGSISHAESHGVLTKPHEVHHKRVIRTQDGREVILYVTVSGIVLLAPLSVF